MSLRLTSDTHYSPRESTLSKASTTKSGNVGRLSKDDDPEFGLMRNSDFDGSFTSTSTRKKGPRRFLSGVRFHAQRTIHTKFKHRKNDETFKAAYTNFKDSMVEIQELKVKLEPLRKLYKELQQVQNFLYLDFSQLLTAGTEVDIKIEEYSKNLNVKMGGSYDQLFRNLDSIAAAIDECSDEFSNVKQLVIQRDKNMITLQGLQKKLEKLKPGTQEFLNVSADLEEQKLLFESSNVQMIDTFEHFDEVRMELVRVQFSKLVGYQADFFGSVSKVISESDLNIQNMIRSLHAANDELPGSYIKSFMYYHKSFCPFPEIVDTLPDRCEFCAHPSKLAKAAIRQHALSVELGISDDEEEEDGVDPFYIDGAHDILEDDVLDMKSTDALEEHPHTLLSRPHGVAVVSEAGGSVKLHREVTPQRTIPSYKEAEHVDSHRLKPDLRSPSPAGSRSKPSSPSSEHDISSSRGKPLPNLQEPEVTSSRGKALPSSPILESKSNRVTEAKSNKTPEVKSSGKVSGWDPSRGRDRAI